MVKDPKGFCQIAVPPEWTLMDQATGAASMPGGSTVIAVVTAQPEQVFKPLSPTLLRVLNVPKEKLFENSAKRIFYQDKVSTKAEDPNGYSSSVPGRSGTCSCRLTVVPSVTEEIAKTIALSLAPVPEKEKTEVP
jgi:hypothetical protein